MQIGPITAALEDQDERNALKTFFVETILPLEIVSKKISEKVVEELVKYKIIGPGESAILETARNTVALNSIKDFLAKTFVSEWKERKD